MPTADEFAALQQALAEATQRSEKLAGELRVVRTERDLLQEQLNRFTRRLFGASSEVGGTHQKERHELPEGERVCPHDGAVLREIGVETSEQYDIIPQQVRVIRHERVKYACPCCDGGMRLAPRPPQVIPKGLFTENAIAWVISSKYLDGLPLYRQAALLGRFGGTDVSRNTLAATVVRSGQATQPVINLLRDMLLDSPIVYGDETEVQVLKEAGRSAQAKSYMWVQMTNGSGKDGTGPPIRLFAYAPSRSLQTAKRLYAGMRLGAVLMSDGYEPYRAACSARRCTTCRRSGRRSSATWTTAACRSTTTPVKTASGHLSSGGAIGCSPTQWPAPTRARTCTRCCRHARPEPAPPA